MGKQYIATSNCSAAHKSDILDCAVSKKYTITVGSDGYIKLWINDSKDLSSPKDSVIEKFVNNKGLHKVAFLEDTIEGDFYLIIAVTSFDGRVYFYRIVEGDFIELDIPCGSSNNYAIAFLQNSAVGHRFAVSEPSGAGRVYRLLVENDTIGLELYGKLESKVKNFATSIALEDDGSTVALGLQNGDVHLFDLESLKPTYSFLGHGLKASSTTVRDIKYSPVGKILAVARDSGSYGTITLYDVYYGETIGTLTAASHSSNVSVGGHAHDGWCFTVDFNETGELLLSAGYDQVIRVWSVESREREATISISTSDFVENENENDDEDENEDVSVITAAKFVNKGYRSAVFGGDKNEGICCVGFDRGIRWFREAGGV